MIGMTDNSDPEINKEELSRQTRDFVNANMTPAEQRRAKSDQIGLIAPKIAGTKPYIEEKNRKTQAALVANRVPQVKAHGNEPV